MKFPQEESLSGSEWLSWLESELSFSNINLKRENPNGVSCLSWNALSSLKSPYVFLTGLSEEAVNISEGNIFDEAEGGEILNSLGFPLPIKDPKEKEKQLLWLLQSSSVKELCLSFSSYDFKGDIQTESLICSLSDVLFGAVPKDIASLPEAGGQASSPSVFLSARGASPQTARDVEKALQHKQKAFFLREGLSLSPQTLKTYAECPFKYAADKLFLVRSRPSSDRELSPLSKGGSAHRLLESVLRDRVGDWDLSEDQIDGIIKGALPDEREMICKEQAEVAVEELKSLFLRFKEKEQNLSSKYPFLEPLALESEVSAFWDPEKGISSEGKYPFKARIDRIDRDKIAKTYVVRDYKSSNAGLNHISSWLEEGKEDLQLAFYAQAVEKGLIEDLPAGQVSALFYSCYREDFSAKGFEDKDSAVTGVMGDKLRANKQSRKSLLQAIEQSHKKTRELVGLMERGYFSPKPKELSLCARCPHKHWCRVDAL